MDTKVTTDSTRNENEIAKQILNAALLGQTKLGPGVFESVCEMVLAHELRKKGLVGERQKPLRTFAPL
jgi:hypothetical protein